MIEKMPLALVVEDSPTQAGQITANLNKHGVRTIVVTDGPDALRAVDEHMPDLVVLDLNLPSMDGFQVCRRLKRDTKTAHIPVIMLTSSETFDHMMQGLEIGASDYIPKDIFAGKNLLSTLRNLGIVGK